jgi:D-tyrosyl-tRNA(Tyr) deacylase
MKVIIQKVSHASVEVDQVCVAQIKKGYLILVGIASQDRQEDLDWMVHKIKHLRIFEDEQQKMNLDITQVQGEILAVSQFTLFADCKKGNRPSFTSAAPPEKAKADFDRFVEQIKQVGIPCQTGIFRAQMAVSLCNDGPITIMLDSQDR